jgi:hypothetical protein
VGDDGDVAKVHSCSSGSDNGWSAISPENRDPLFRITLKNLDSGGHRVPKRKPGQKTGQALLVAPQYSQESPENNALFAIWLADLGSNQPASATLGLFGGCDPARHFLKLLFGGLERRRL